MRRNRQVFLISMVGLALIAGLAFALLLPSALRAPSAAAGQGDRFEAHELALLREGDIVLRRGDSLASSLIVRVMGSPAKLSHCALLVNADPDLMDRITEDRVSFRAGKGSLEPGGLAVIHAVSASLSKVDGIQVEELGRFNEHSAEGSLVVVRPRMTGEQRTAYLERAKGMLSQGLAFDNGYRLDAEGPLYCSELFHRSFAAASWEGQASWTDHGGILTFDGFLDPRFFDIILSHNPSVPASRPPFL